VEVEGLEAGKEGGAERTRQTREHILLTSENNPDKHIEVETKSETIHSFDNKG